MTTKTQEKRLFSRIECLVDLELVPMDGGSCGICELEAFNLSISGLGVRFDPRNTRLTPGQRTLVCLSGFQPIKARVCWVINDRAGLSFEGGLPAITESWVGELLASQGVTHEDLVNGL